MEVYLLRHGQSEANAGLTDHLDSPLTALGREQARRAGERLAEEIVTRLYVSPLRRTLQTTGYVCDATGLDAEINADACEFFSPRHEGFRTFPGLSPEQIMREFPFARVGDTFPCEPSWWPQEPEDDALIYARAVRVRDALLPLYAATDERLVIVSHADTVGRLTEAFLRVPPAPDNPPWSDNCALTCLYCSPNPSAPAVLRFRNDASHIPPDLRS